MDREQEPFAARFGQFEVVSRIGVGGMGEVFRARMPARGAGAEVALKLIRPEHAAQERFRRLFEAEVRISALLHHPRIVELYEYGDIDGIPFLAMELVEGVSLEKVLGDGPLAPPLAAHVVLQLLEALGHLHALRSAEGTPLHLVHRDVSPGNVLLSIDGDVKLTDFGVARLPGVSLTQTNEVKGKRSYMAPEQLDGQQPVDGRADLFAAAVLLYRAEVGEMPFRDAEEWIRRGAPRATESAFAEVLDRALAPKPGKRYANAEELAAAIRGCAPPPAEARRELATRVRAAMDAEKPLAKLDRVLLARLDQSDPIDLREEEHTPAPAPPPPETRRRRARSLPIGWVSLAAAVALATGVGGWALSRRNERTATPPPRPATRVAPPIAPVAIAAPPVVTPPPVVVPPPDPVVRRNPPAERHAERARTTPAAPLAPGFLSLDTDPWATAYLDGRRLGTTPFIHVEVPAGHHRLSLDVQNSGRRRPLAIDVKPGTEERVRAHLDGPELSAPPGESARQ